VETYLVIGLGSALGGMARHWFGVAADDLWGPAFPWGTLIVNVVGSFAIGLVFALTLPDGRWPTGPLPRHFLMAGFCGGYTTFSAFSIQALQMLEGREFVKAGAYALASVALCLAATWIGQIAANGLGPSRA
jgi:CrcB protein